MIRPWLITHPAQLQQSSDLFDWQFPEGRAVSITVIFEAAKLQRDPGIVFCTLRIVNIIVDNRRTGHVECALPMFGRFRRRLRCYRGAAGSVLPSKQMLSDRHHLYSHFG
jgi:hypothetical protein